MRRAAVSVPSNIAEGKERRISKDFKQFLHIALGSISELEAQLLIAKDLYKLSEIDRIIDWAHEEQRMIMGFINKINQQ